MVTDMIVILCDDFWQAVDRFHQFVEFISVFGHEEIVEMYDKAYCVITDADLKYVFVDWRLAPLFKDTEADIIDEGEFFENLLWG